MQFCESPSLYAVVRDAVVWIEVGATNISFPSFRQQQKCTKPENFGAKKKASSINFSNSSIHKMYVGLHEWKAME
jgi:hypothetical protein